jgi:Electron transfer DM13
MMPLLAADGKDVYRVEFPSGKSIQDYLGGSFSVWCETALANFGEVLIPSKLPDSVSAVDDSSLIMCHVPAGAPTPITAPTPIAVPTTATMPTPVSVPTPVVKPTASISTSSANTFGREKNLGCSVLVSIAMMIFCP